MDTPQLIPAWVVSLMAFLAATALWGIRPMPWRIRVSLILPIIYFAAEYLYFSIYPTSIEIRADLTRLGLLMIFGTITLNAALASWKWRKENKHHAHPKPS